ncbi:MAG: PD-(D/E)XK nuclease family protein [Candidatus Levybacteria bacterium]|nr:PD-(D/E)XK nuclease family protein [Candidatus Levybacteria bacterium]
MTRARDYLFLTASNFYGEGRRERKISPFVYETLGEEAVKKSTLRLRSGQAKTGQLTLLEWKQPTSPPASNLQPPASNITYLSYSQIQTFDICPLHYKLKYLLKIPVPQTAAQSFGTSVHSTLRDFYQAWIRGEKLRVDKAISILEKNWINERF